jgi:hypothetical protein
MIDQVLFDNRDGGGAWKAKLMDEPADLPFPRHGIL